MVQKTIYNLWEETVSARPRSRDIFKGMHLAVLQQAVREQPSEHLYTIRFEIQDFVLCESKGNLQTVTSLELPAKEKDILWLCLQLQGKLVLSNGKVMAPDGCFSFVRSDEDPNPTLPAEKNWSFFIGVSGASKQQLMAELPPLRKAYEQVQDAVLRAVPISHVERKILDNLTKASFGPFSTLHRLGLFIQQLYAGYLQQLSKNVEPIKEHADVQLYHKAIAHIRDNYMNEVINREKIADALCCSVRSLTRAFEGRPASANVVILTFRIYKGRELLRERPELSVEQIALMLHFSNISHFINQYKKCFHHTPREERKKVASWKE